MNVSKKSLCFLALWSLCGCVTTTTENGRPIPNRHTDFSDKLKKLTDPVKQAVSAVTPQETLDPIPWDWATGIPREVSKSESLPAIVPEEMVAALVPAYKQSQVQTASTANPSALSVQVVNETKIRNFADLHASVEAALSQDKKKTPVVEFGQTLPGAAATPIAVTPNDLIGIEHATLPTRTVVRIVEDGNPWVLVKDNSVRCKLMVRREQRIGMVHVVVAIKNCWGAPVELPADLRVSSGGQDLPCLNVAEILSQLYEANKRTSSLASNSEDFNRKADADDYLIPVNYKQLEAKLAADTRLASIRPEPAFATVGGYAYPGPPVLGDARALSAFMLQPRVYAADEQEHVGWVVCANSDLDSGDIQVMVDLGSGPQTIQFTVPH